ncbi:MAG: hypothetical protein WA902_00390 [Thermosynechococcaceae cyanobacterium]
MGIQPEFSHKYQRRQSDAGFALPVAIGLGLIMLLLGVTMIVRSQNDQVNASAQKATAESLAAAEVGVSKVQAFLNLYRVLATVPNTGSSSWANRASINVNNIVNASCSAGNVEDDRDALYSTSSGDWFNVDPSDTATPPAQGQFRTVSYLYNPTNNRGTLTVQGKVNAGQPGESVAQVQVEIPVQASPSVTEQAIPLWVKDSITGTPTINGPVMGPCTLSDVSSATSVIRTNLMMPAPPADPSIPLPSNPSLAPTNPSKPLGDLDPDDKTISPYSIANLNRSFTILSGSEVRIWTSGDIDWRNQYVQCVINDATPAIACPPGDPFKVTVYASGSGTLLLDSKSVLCNVHFYAPGYDVKFSDGGPPAKNCGTVNSKGQPIEISGTFWVNSWEGDTGWTDPGGGTSGSIALDQSTVTQKITLPPLIEPIARWERQEVK